MLNAFCVDTEEWFHICGVKTKFSDPSTWDDAASHVVADTDKILRLLDDAGAHGTFLTVGWVAERYPELIRRIANAGHEVGCHSYLHQLVYSLQPDEFETDLVRALEIVRDASGQPVTTYRAPSFSITNECFWAYPILRRHGIQIDVSLVPARRANGGVTGVQRDPFRLLTAEGALTCFPVSVMNLLGRTIPFSGGGYLRLLPQSLINQGFRRNHSEGRVGMSYIHPREVNPDQPRMKLPPLRYFKYYVNLGTTERKLAALLREFEFTTVSEVVDSLVELPVFEIAGKDLVTCSEPIQG